MTSIFIRLKKEQKNGAGMEIFIGEIEEMFALVINKFFLLKRASKIFLCFSVIPLSTCATLNFLKEGFFSWKYDKKEYNVWKLIGFPLCV